MESKPDIFYGYLEEGVYGEFRHVPEPSPNKDKIGFIFGSKRYEFSIRPNYEFKQVSVNPSLTIYQKWIYRVNEGLSETKNKAMEKPDFEALVKNISTEDWDYDLAIAGTSPSGRFSCGKEDVIELLEHVWNTHVVPLQDENERLKTTLMAGAELIKENWEKLCDEEGHGPQNLLLRMDGTLNTSGYPGYSSGAFERLESENKALREENTKCKELSWEAANEISRLKKEIERLEAEVLKEKFPEN